MISCYPSDEWAGFKKYDRRSPFVEVKIAESTYRETAHVLKEWTAVNYIFRKDWIYGSFSV